VLDGCLKTIINVAPLTFHGKIFLVRKGYRNLSIPEQLYREIEEFMEKSKGRYVSVAEVVREAIREFLDKHK
jgi:predicted nucleic acid-binding protein